jgi:hypothetical protein
MKRAGEAISELRRKIFFRAGPEASGVAHGGSLQIIRRESGFLRDPGKHLGPELNVIVKGEGRRLPSVSLEGAMRPLLADDTPSNAFQCCQHSAGLRGTPGPHAAPYAAPANDTASNVSGSSLASI